MGRRRALQLFFIFHAVVHVLAFQAAWGFGAMDEFSATPAFPTASAGSLTAHLLGALWLVAAITFLSAAILVGSDDRRWPATAATAALISLTVCVLWWEDAPAGAALDLLVLGAVATRAVRHLDIGPRPIARLGGALVAVDDRVTSLPGARRR